MKKNQIQVQGKETTLGERPIRIYIYEALNRLIHATGKAKNDSYDMAMTFGRMSEPLTKVQKVDSTTTAKSYNFAYKYTRVRDKKRLEKVGNLVKNSYLYRWKSIDYKIFERWLPRTKLLKFSV